MKKKLVLAIALAAFVAAGTAFASPAHPADRLAVGAYTSLAPFPGFSFGGGLSLKIPNVPVFWGVSANAGIFNWGIMLQGDHYFLGGAIGETVSWFLGAGADVGLWFWSGGWYNESGLNAISFGLRLPVGISWRATDLIEVFLSGVPRLGASVGIGDYADGFNFLITYGGLFRTEVGLRFWF
jgi:hypothetical protein